MTDAVSSDLKPKIDGIDWAKLSRSQRKREWLRLCLSAVKRLERLLVELKTERMTEQGLCALLTLLARNRVHLLYLQGVKLEVVWTIRD